VKLGNTNRPTESIAILPVEHLQTANGLRGHRHLRFCTALAKFMSWDNSKQQHSGRVTGCSARLGYSEQLQQTPAGALAGSLA